MDGIEMGIVTAEQMRNLDRRATEVYGIPSLLLMENAGRAVFQAAVEMLGDVSYKKIVIVAGPGNNGGDGFVVARFLHNAEAQVRVFYFGDKSKAQGDALANLQIAEKMNLDIDYSGDVNALLDALNEADLVIDAFLGTGTKGELRPDAAEVVRAMILRACPLISVDIPSGVDADTGELLGAAPYCAVNADVTVTFGLPKIGLVTYPGRTWVGRLMVADIGIPREDLEEESGDTFLLTSDFAMLEPRQEDSNKGTYGHLAIIAGSAGLTGAATLAAQGALRIGTGLVTLAVPESLNDIFEAKLTEAMTVPVPQGSARAFGMASLESVLEVIAKSDAVVIGPGFGRNEDTIEFTLELIKRLDKHAIIDADALYAIAKDPSVLMQCKVPLIITPHPGEMARLTGTSVEEVQSNRLEVARKFAGEYGVTVVLKGAATVIADPDGLAFINTNGTPGLATGGTGDVLSGMIGGLMAQEQHMRPWPSAAAGVWLHSRAGEIAAERMGEVSMIAGDVVDALADAIKEVMPEMS